MLTGMLGACGVETTYVAASPESVTSAAIILVDANGQRNIISKRGNNYDFCREDINEDAITDTRALSIGSIYGMPKAGRRRAARRAAACLKHGVC